jgi:hypothetical protein
MKMETAYPELTDIEKFLFNAKQQMEIDKSLIKKENPLKR